MEKDKELMTDQDLIHLVRESDPSGLSIVYERYRREFLSWMRKFCRCSDDQAKDFYQAAILILYENIMSNKLEELQSSLKTYLFAIGKNLALQDHRKIQRKETMTAAWLLDQHIFAGSEDMIREDEDIALIGRCFNKIGDPCHKLLELFYFRQQNMDEISVTLGYKNTDSAKNQKYKCMERLRKLVEDERTTNLTFLEN
jgi:RNA polymerase sigma-70 factor (ECF subfamily)